ncbi:hypothetical protein ACHAXS_008765 [Conticribra weissflogii]
MFLIPIIFILSKTWCLPSQGFAPSYLPPPRTTRRRIIPTTSTSILPKYVVPSTASSPDPSEEVAPSFHSDKGAAAPFFEATATDSNNPIATRVSSKSAISSTLPSLTLALTLTLTMTLPSHPSAANAIQPKNEALCNTGFFTNVGAWYCTDIGNIGDEGRSKPLSGGEEERLDGLLGKLNFDSGGNVDDDYDDGNGGGNSRGGGLGTSGGGAGMAVREGGKERIVNGK